MHDGAPALRASLAAYARPSAGAGTTQLAVALGAYAACWAGAYLALDLSLALAAALVLPAAGLMVRIFIIQHDCGHGAFFRSPRANRLAGRICSLVTLTPYTSWLRQHARHHGRWNDLDRRGGNLDIYSSCGMVRDYCRLPPVRRWLFRLVRHPAVAHLALPPLIFLLLYRVPFDTPADARRERRSVWATNLCLAALFTAAGALLGFGPVALVELAILVPASIVGVWLFALQHRFEDALWTHEREWDATAASLRGTSCLRLPRVLQWFTGNIGYHHLHHLNPRVPNYRLQQAYDAIPALRAGPTLGLRDGLRAVRYVLWDDERRCLVRFRDLAPAPGRALNG